MNSADLLPEKTGKREPAGQNHTIRFFAIVLTFFLTMLPLTAWGMDAVFGTVVSSDKEEKTMVVVPFFRPGELQQDSTAPGEIPENIIVLFPRVELPDCIRTDGPVRLWGEFISDAPALFKASYIRGMGKGHTHDPTGVRGRFEKGRGTGKRHGQDQEERDDAAR